MTRSESAGTGRSSAQGIAVRGQRAGGRGGDSPRSPSPRPRVSAETFSVAGHRGPPGLPLELPLTYFLGGEPSPEFHNELRVHRIVADQRRVTQPFGAIHH